MTALRVWLQRLSGFLRRGKLERDLEEEISFHLQTEIDENLRRGMTPGEARAAALRHFGGVTRTKETYRETHGLPALETTLADLRYSFRTLRQSPAFTAVAILSLALGIGANTAIFSLLNAVVLRTLPIADPGRLVQFIYTIPKTGPDNWNPYFGYPQFERFQQQTQTLSGVFCSTSVGRLNVNFRGASELAQGNATTVNTFTALGLTPQFGRFFAADEERADAAVIILSDRYWRNRFGSDPAIVGAALTINQIPFTVIGVAPEEFQGLATGNSPDLWVPLHTLDRVRPLRTRWTEPFTSWLTIVGRLRPGVSLSQAQSELDIIHRRQIADELTSSGRGNSESLRRFVRESHLQLHPAATGISSGIGREYALPLKLLMWVAGIVLLVACANIANLLLARASNRRREIAVRLSLGAGRGRIVRQLLTENLLLASIGGSLALILAWWGSLALVRMISTGDTPLPIDTHPDWRIFGFTAAISLLTGLLFGIAPALRATRIDPGPALKQGSQSAGRSSHTLDRLLVVVQVALSIVLLTGAGLFVRTLHKLWTVNTGYDRENVFMFSVDSKLAGYPDERASGPYREILRRLQSLPDVRSVSASIVRPIDDQFDLIDRIGQVDFRDLPEQDAIHVAWNSITPNYFSTVSTPLLLGRDFSLRDDETAPKVCIVNQTLAARAVPGRNPIGHRLEDATIVGMVKDSLYQGARDRPKPVLYRPLFQHGHEQEYHWGFVSFEIRYRSGNNLLGLVRREVAAVDRNLPIFRAKTLRTQTEESLVTERLLATLSSFFGVLALVLSCLGLFGLMAYSVASRTGEIGIRIALGAHRPHVMWLVLRETLFLSLAGIACGLPLALWAARYARSMLFAINPADPLTIAIAIGLLTAVASLAACIPVRRALRVDPMSALRCE